MSRVTRPQPGTAANRPAHDLGWIALIVLATAVVYWPVRHYPFVSWDDIPLVASNPHLAHGVSWTTVRWALTTTSGGYWTPLTWLSRILDVGLFGLNPGWHHVTNVVIHLFNIVLLFVVLARMTGRATRSLIVAALFALHPMHVESVAWIAERKDVLSATGFLLTLLAYEAYVRRGGRGRYGLVLAMLCASAMAKPMVVTLPAVLLLLDVWPLERVTLTAGARGRWVPLLREKLPLLVAAAVAGVITVVTQQAVGAVASLHVYPLRLRLENAVLSYGRYLVKMGWPLGLAAYYPLAPHVLPPWYLVMASAALLVCISLAVMRRLPRSPAPAVGWSWWLLMLLPVIGLVQSGDQAMADRFTYLPSIGLFVMVIWALADWLPARPRARAATALVTVAVLGMLAIDARVQLGYWRDSLSLWQRSLDVAPAFNFRARGGVADALAASGHADEAIAQYHEALGLLPRSAEMHDHLGLALEQTHQTAAARSEFNTAVLLDGRDPEAHNNLGAMLARGGETRAAISEYAVALQLSPDFAQARYNMGLARAQTGDVAGGVELCRQALAEDPSHPDWHAATARLLARLGQKAEAIEELQAALALDPSYESARIVLQALTSTANE